MPKSMAAKRGAGRGQSKVPPAPPAKKARKEASKPAAHEKENAAPEQDVSAKNDKPNSSAFPQPEKTRSVAQVIPADPVSQRVVVVQNAIEDEMQVGLLNLPSYVCEMLRIAVPTALGIGSAADERHAIQRKMADTVGTYLQQVVVICQDSLKEKEELLQAAQSTKEQGMSALAALEAQLEEKAILVHEKQGNFDDAGQALSAAKEKALVPQQEVDALDEDLQQTRSQRDKYQKVLTSSFDVLKACDWSSSIEQKKAEKKLFGPLNTLLKQIDADTSLVEAASNALAKNPAQRGDFDVMVVGQLEDVLHQPLAVLDEQIRQQESDKAEKLAQMQEGKAAIALAEQQLSSCDAELVAYKKEENELKAHVQAFTAAAKDPDQLLKQARTAHDTILTSLEKAKESSAAFQFLYERRVAPLPEPAPPVAVKPQENEVTPATVVETKQTEMPSQLPELREGQISTDIIEVPALPKAPISEEALEGTRMEVAMPLADAASQGEHVAPLADAESQEADVTAPMADDEVVVAESASTAVAMPVEDSFTAMEETKVVAAELPSVVVEMHVEDSFAEKEEEFEVEAPAEEPVEAAAAEEPAEEPAEKADPCWEFVRGLEPGSDPFLDRKSNSEDASALKQECRDLNAVAVTTTGRIKFTLPPRDQWVPPRDDEDDFGTWVWKGYPEAKVNQAFEEGTVAL